MLKSLVLSLLKRVLLSIRILGNISFPVILIQLAILGNFAVNVLEKSPLDHQKYHDEVNGIQKKEAGK